MVLAMLTRIRTTALAATVVTLALAGTASADSISFLRGGDIWVASPDGSRQVQVTHDGGYSYQSQSDDGTFIALKGRRLHRIDRSGTVLADFSTPVSAEKTSDDESYFMGPFDPEISPDGTKVVYSYLWQYIYRDPGCVGADWLCTEKHLYQGVGYSYADRMTGWDELGRQSGWVHPSWMSNDRVMLSDPSEPLNLSVMYDDVGTDNQDIKDWFTDEGTADMEDGEISRNGSMMVYLDSGKAEEDPSVRAEASRISFYRMTGTAPAVPERCYTLGYAQGQYEGPSWSPDGAHVAYVDVAGDETGKLLIADVPNLADGCQAGADARIVIENARHADWGPADVPVGSNQGPNQQQGPSRQPQQQNPNSGPNQPDTNAGPTPAVTRTVSLRGSALRRALRRGLVLRFRAPAGGRVSMRASKGRRAVANGSATAARAGTVAVRLRFTARGRRALRGAHSARLTVRTTFAAS